MAARPLGYKWIYKPDHPHALVNGCVYEHVLVMEEKLGHAIPAGMEVHHKDFNRRNNNIKNLVLLSKADHARLHNAERTHARGGVVLAELPNIICKTCKKSARPTSEDSHFCSVACSARFRRKAKRPEKKELHRLVWSMSTVSLAKKFGVSDKAIEKWCKAAGVEKPPRGYWAQQYALERK